MARFITHMVGLGGDKNREVFSSRSKNSLREQGKEAGLCFLVVGMRLLPPRQGSNDIELTKGGNTRLSNGHVQMWGRGAEEERTGLKSC